MIKQKTITTDRATVLVVELPERIVEISNTGKRIAIPDRKGGHHFIYGNWQLIGRIPDITEGYVYELIPEVITPIMGFKAYPNFDKDGYCKTALESFFSLLQANEVYFENPIPPFKERLEDWHEAQSKVWDKERCYLFIKED